MNPDFDWLMTPPPSDAAANDLAARLASSTGFKVLREVTTLAPDAVDYATPHPIGMAIDTETTGLDNEADEIIELSMIPFQYDRETGRILRIARPYTGRQDPGRPLTDEIQSVTGLTDADLVGRSLDTVEVERMVSKASLCISHNATFDRRFMERKFPVFARQNWLCSNEGFAWRAAGFGSSKLEFIAMKMGFFYGAHRSEIDTLAMLNILRDEVEGAGRSVFRSVLEIGREDSLRVLVVNSPFETKDRLKKAGFFWNAPENGMRSWPKCWWKEIRKDQWPETAAFLRNGIGGQIRLGLMTAKDRYTERMTRNLGVVSLGSSLDEILNPPPRPTEPVSLPVATLLAPQRPELMAQPAVPAVPTAESAEPLASLSPAPAPS